MLRKFHRPVLAASACGLAAVWLIGVAQCQTPQSQTPQKGEAKAQPAANLPTQWVAISSRETSEAPTLVVTPESGEAKSYPAVADAPVISYLADRNWGRLTRLSVSLSDTNRVLLRFDVPTDIVIDRAELVLKRGTSQMPPTQPFEVGIYEVQAEWDEFKVMWMNQPKFADKPAVKFTFDPNAAEVRVDITALMKSDGREDAPNHGWLLKVTKPLSPVNGPVQNRPNGLLDKPQPFFVKWLWLPVIGLVLFGLSQSNLGLVQRIAFRFSFAYWLLYSLLEPLPRLIPFSYGYKLNQLYDSFVNKAVHWTANNVLGITQLFTGPTGSGDTTVDYIKLLLFFTLACVVAVVWSAVDWRRTDHPWLKDLLRSYLRYVLAFAMLSYGLSKVGSVVNQFSEPDVERLMRTYGDSSPMGLVWTFMGASRAYTRFAGMGEVAGALLLIWRRTTILGAAVTFGVMLNVMMLNFCYDVPVKQYSFHLLVMALYLLLVDAPRLANLLIWNQPVDKVSLLPPYTNSRTIWVQRALKAYIIVMGVAWPVGHFLYGERYPANNRLAQPAFFGTYEVDEFLVNGQSVPPLLTDKTRWKTLTLTRSRFGPGGVRTPINYFSVRMLDRTQRGGPFKLSADEKTLTLELPAAGVLPPEMTVELPDDRHLSLTGTANGKTVEVKLHKLKREDFLLMNRGFHWINELPLNY